ncbi:MAG: glycoside hydrolase domain-containing protein, partial [Sediminibacterium sp.]
LKGPNGAVIHASKFTCINLEGIGYDQVPFKKVVNVDANLVQSLWCGVDVPVNTIPGNYQGKITVSSDEFTSNEINFNLMVNNHTIANGGADAPWNQTRLKWLNSTLAQKNEVIAPYTNLVVKGHDISLLGRKVILDVSGLPQQIQSFFNTEMTGVSLQGKNIFSAPLQFLSNGKPMTSINNSFKFTHIENGKVAWSAKSKNDQLEMHVNGSLEFDGFMVFTIQFTALKNTDIDDIQLLMPFEKNASKYMMGLGQKGGFRPDQLNWKWEVATKNQDGAWIGDVNAGIQFSLRDENYVRPLNTNFYLQKPLLLPTSWGNDNKGGINMIEKGNQVIVNNYSGARHLQKGASLFYNFTLLITPFHTLNTDFQWDAKFFHAYKPIDTIKSMSSAKIVNIHHANEINPWINYPFIEHKKMKSYIDHAHDNGLKVKIYNTVRELSNHAYETFPLRSLGHEIYSPGKGGGYSWLQEHLGDDYIAAWFVPNIKDAAIVNSGMSRWHNYYIEGMNWLVKNVGIDGIYLDDVAFDRITMKRVKRVLTQQNHPGIIDLHSANQYNKNDGFNNSANLYMEHFPYINKLWFGEYFDYQKATPDFYLTEVSGIPFGLMGEMLQDGGNPYRGLIYGMTNRMPWDENADPRAIWKLWDDFGIQGSKMIGYWSENCPVKTNSDHVLATVYKKDKAIMIAFASWSDKIENINLRVDWKKLGL